MSGSLNEVPQKVPGAWGRAAMGLMVEQKGGGAERRRGGRRGPRAVIQVMGCKGGIGETGLGAGSVIPVCERGC